MVWIRAAGICSKPGCGNILHEDPNLLTPLRIGEAAHIIGFKRGAARGGDESSALADDPSNLVLLCPTCHTPTDKNEPAYSVDLLRQWKAAHELNVRQAALMTRNRRAVPLVVSGPIGGQMRGIDGTRVMEALRDELYVSAIAHPETITLPGHVGEDGSLQQWSAHAHSLRHELEGVLGRRGIEDFPLAIFPLAEMPSLMLLGHIIGDKRRVLPYQYYRANGTWTFPDPHGAVPEFKFTNPGADCRGSDVVLVLSLSARIDGARVRAAVPDPSVPTIEFTTATPSTDLVRNRATIDHFTAVARRCLEAVEQAIGDRNRTIHVMPAMPAPLAVAFGGTIMPKVSNVLEIYDARGVGGPFTPALQLPILV